jgi:hypothetical protein
VRQQWNFSPPNAMREVEDYGVDLSDVTVLELIIVPDTSRGSARASLKSLRLSRLAAAPAKTSSCGNRLLHSYRIAPANCA